MPVFHNILVASKVEEAAIDTLANWYPTYIREIERQLGMTPGKIAYPTQYSNRNSFDFLPGEVFPKVCVVSPGLASSPVRKGDGQYRATWRLGVGIAATAKDEAQANMLAKIYGAGARAILEQKQSLNGLATEIRWIDESYDDLPVLNQNQLAKVALVQFTVDCDNVLTKWIGPETPDEEPYIYGRVEKVIIEKVLVPIDEEVNPYA